MYEGSDTVTVTAVMSIMPVTQQVVLSMFIAFILTCHSYIAIFFSKVFFTPYPLRAVGVLFSPMVYG